MKSKKSLCARLALLPAVLIVCSLTSQPSLAEKPTTKPINQVVVVDSNGRIVGNANVGVVQQGRPTILLKVGERGIAGN